MEFNFPKDTSLDSKKYNLLMGEIKWRYLQQEEQDILVLV
jgi:hypothetical protein